MSSYLSHQCALLSAFETARIPDKSFISNPFVSIKDLHLIPATLWQDFGDEIVELSPSESYFDMVNRGILFVRSATNHSLLVESEGMGQRLIEVARADFNNDGIEEIFLFQYSYATRGTFGYGDTIMLTRKSSDKMFEVVT